MENTTNRSQATKIRWLCVTAMLGAMASVLEFLNFKVPVMPSFISFDIAELPALIASFSMGALSGACVCLIKNLVNLMHTSTGGVGELSNFLLGCAFVVPAGLIYQKHKTKKRAIIGALIGAVCMAVLGVFTNYFIVYPIYTNFMPMEAIISAYQAINPKADTLLKALLMFNLPFTFVKALTSTIICVLIYKYISPILKGTNTPKKKKEKE